MEIDPFFAPRSWDSGFVVTIDFTTVLLYMVAKKMIESS